jgi:hypothetical protein
VTYLKKFYFHFFILFFLILGIHLSLNTGITHDEFHDFNVWQANKNSILNFFLNENFDTSYLEGTNRFYGSGFHYFSTILEFFFINLPQLNEYTEIGKKILSKHVSVFVLFLFSGLLIKKIMKIITKNETQASLSAIFYLLYPYLLGHSFFNIKDIPFLSVWLICTYFMIRIVKNYFFNDVIFKKHIFVISFFTAYLLSIRISGILIFIQYLIFILLLVNNKHLNFYAFIQKHIKEIITAFLIIVVFYIILQPSYWTNPFLIFDAIIYMSQHAQSVCTITLQECMEAQNLPASYLPIWFFFKLPIIILFGLFLFFQLEKKIKKNTFSYLILTSLSLTVISIIILLIIFNVNLYDEIRQVMFLVPLIFIISLSLIHFFSFKFFKFSIIPIIVFFIFQNISMFPYNYIWINNFSHFTKVQNIFELDYWSVSTKNVSKFIKNDNNKNLCIITNRNDAIDNLISGNNCLIDFSKLHEKNKRPFYVSLMGRGTKKGVPNNCDLILEEQTKMNFSKEILPIARVYKCN